MNKIVYLLIVFILLAQRQAGAAPADVYCIRDSVTHEAIPFATIRFGGEAKGTVADLDGRFTMPFSVSGTGAFIEISSLGYQTRKLYLPLRDSVIFIAPGSNYLGEVVIQPPADKIKRIIRAAIAAKDRNNPDKYDGYRCHVYYKMTAEVSLPDSVLKKDTSKNLREFRKFTEQQHLLLSETYSIRTWQKPQQLQEEVLASRISGFRKSLFTSLVTDVVPFHSYSEYLTLNGKDYHNPISHGFQQNYRFELTGEIVQGNDTVWMLSFSPRGHKANDLTGIVYINSDGFAISHIVAKAYDTMLRLNVRIEQEYTQIAADGAPKKWFPKNLNYIVDWEQQSKKSSMTLHMKGTSRIDSVSWTPDNHFRFDKTHTVKLMTGADELSDTAWNKTRPDPLDAKERQTYHFMDSLGQKYHSDRFMHYFSKAPEGKVPLGVFDVDLNRLFSYNYHENLRLGMGLQTNETVIPWLSAGGWAGYGFGDKKWKYGVFAEGYGNRYKDLVFRIGYSDDINDPGRIHLSHDLDKNYLNSYLLRLVDNTKTYYASIKRKAVYWTTELTLRQQQIDPQYPYALLHSGEAYRQFTATEALLHLRFAFAERTAPFFGSYYSLGSRFPVWYGNFTAGQLQRGDELVPYTQAVSAVAWQKHINRIGNEHFLLEGGKSWSADPLPLSKLFAGNGYQFDLKGNLQASIYTFGGLMTVYPYEFYADQYVNFLYRHDFDWKLYRLQHRDLQLSSAPNICIQYNILYGTLAHPEAQRLVNFSVPDHAYQEAGLMLNNLLRVRYYNLYYITLNVGYFYHISNATFLDGKSNGRFAYGAGIEL